MIAKPISKLPYNLFYKSNSRIQRRELSQEKEFSILTTINNNLTVTKPRNISLLPDNVFLTLNLTDLSIGVENDNMNNYKENYFFSSQIVLIRSNESENNKSNFNFSNKYNGNIKNNKIFLKRNQTNQNNHFESFSTTSQLTIDYDEYGLEHEPSLKDITTGCEQYFSMGKFIPYESLEFLSKVIFQVESFDKVKNCYAVTKNN